MIIEEKEVLHLVYRHNNDNFYQFVDAWNDYKKNIDIINDILADACTNAYLDPNLCKYRYLEFHFLGENITSELCNSNDPKLHFIDYENFTLDKQELFEMIKLKIKEFITNTYIIQPKTVIIGKCLEKALMHGKLPNRYVFELFNLKIIYDSSIDGITFI